MSESVRRSEDENTEELVGWSVASQDKARVSYKVTVRPRSAVPGLPALTKTQMRKKFKSNIWRCNCNDFMDITPDICKHIGYVILTELRD